MTETRDLTRHLFNHCITTADLTDDAWRAFQRDHTMAPEQREQVLLELVQGLCRLCADTTRKRTG
jgi:hypothetical protein